jgi:hypothetical protein
MMLLLAFSKVKLGHNHATCLHGGFTKVKLNLVWLLLLLFMNVSVAELRIEVAN